MSKFKKYLENALVFATVMWFFSRLVIVVAMLLIAPLLKAPTNGDAATFSLDVFYAWDSGWYDSIASSGYEYINDGKQHSVAFFPLFPLLTHLLMNFGFSFKVAGLLINNLTFLGALIILYLWVDEYSGKSRARWATAALAWCPFSLFGTVIYTEGLFLLCTTAALRAFCKGQYIGTGFWGALSTATRVPGVTLIPAFLFLSWKQGKNIKAYIASLCVASGLLLYSFYCFVKFGDALAFVHAQKGWRDSAGFAWQGWVKMLMQILFGPINVKSEYLKDPLYPLLFTLCIGIFYLLWQFRHKLSSKQLNYAFSVLILLMWLLAGDPFIKSVFIFGGLYLLWWSRAKIPLVAVIYGLFSYILIFNTGLTASVERYAYGIISLSFAFGEFLHSRPFVGRFTMVFFAILLASLAVRFAQNVWVS
ncbi:hypothetical protein [Rivularia sp. UHCC 0363]|uniref:hypothetical protein n=1 Tax=Rivularia sp. UHCC 0363 TaxID=3110244 RepID=UPI002B2105CD|nr:hypothetical protein [Rivularia sp. UHCC 0363]MEA5593940.1 hypothetical protein [Rivularia sp. UHCC 0363]